MLSCNSCVVILCNTKLLVTIVKSHNMVSLIKCVVSSWRHDASNYGTRITHLKFRHIRVMVFFHCINTNRPTERKLTIAKCKKNILFSAFYPGNKYSLSDSLLE